MKTLNLFITFILVAILVTACGSAAPTPTSAPAKSNVTLTYMASQDWITDAEQALGKKFEEQTGIHIDYQIIPSDQYFNVLQTKLNAGEATDIFGGQSGVSDLKLQYNVEKNAVDLSGEPWAKQEDPLVAALRTAEWTRRVCSAPIGWTSDDRIEFELKGSYGRLEI